VGLPGTALPSRHVSGKDLAMHAEPNAALVSVETAHLADERIKILLAEGKASRERRQRIGGGLAVELDWRHATLVAAALTFGVRTAGGGAFRPVARLAPAICARACGSVSLGNFFCRALRTASSARRRITRAVTTDEIVSFFCFFMRSPF
jgi:hypothetical protein